MRSETEREHCGQVAVRVFAKRGVVQLDVLLSSVERRRLDCGGEGGWEGVVVVGRGRAYKVGLTDHSEQRSILRWERVVMLSSVIMRWRYPM